MVHFGGRVTEEQFADAMRLMLGKQPHGRGLIVTAVFFLLLAVFLGIELGGTAAGIIIIVFVVPAAMAWWNGSSARFKRLYEKNEGLHQYVRGSFDETEFAYGVNRVPWTSVQRAQSNESVALVYAPHAFIVARSFFESGEEWSAFLERAKAHTPAAGSPAARILKSVLIWVAVIIAVFVLWWLQKS